jgi:hypothetical protein
MIQSNPICFIIGIVTPTVTEVIRLSSQKYAFRAKNTPFEPKIRLSSQSYAFRAKHTPFETIIRLPR